MVRRQYYRALTHTTRLVGLHLDNLENDSYVAWTMSQGDEFQLPQQAIFLNKSVEFQDIALASLPEVLGQSTNPGGEKAIIVDLSEQKLYMKEGGRTVGSFLVSTGKWAPTPTGQWPIWIKLRYTRMRGGSKALGTFYDLPNVPYTMYFYQGYGIHGAYWHNNFGQPMSHGCVNMRPAEAGIVYNWADVGTQVVVQL